MTKHQFEADLTEFVECLDALIGVRVAAGWNVLTPTYQKSLDLAKASCVESLARVILPFDVKLDDPLAKSHKRK